MRAAIASVRADNERLRLGVKHAAPHPGMAAVLALIVPGLGLVYCGRVGAGIATMFLLPAVCFGLVQAGAATNAMSAPIAMQVLQVVWTHSVAVSLTE